MRKRNDLGRVKRYNRSFYRGGRLWKALLKWALVALVVFIVGYFAAPPLIDWGTHTWYTVVRGQQLPASSAAPAPASNVADSQPAEHEPEPTPTATPAPTVAEGSWAMVSLSALSSPEAIQQTAADLKAQGVSYAVITLKDASGYIYYASGVATAQGSIAASTIDAAAVAQAFSAQGILPVAYLSAFRDPTSAYTDRSMGIHYAGSDYMWLDAAADAGGKPWLNPYSATAVQYVGDLIDEVCGLGYENVLLSCVQFPAYVSDRQDFGDTAGVDRAGQLAADIAAWDARFAGQATLWYEVPYASCVTPSTTLGEALPCALGIQRLVIQIPASAAEADSAASQSTQADYQAAAEAMQAGGCTHVVLRDGSTGVLVG